jgi:hypothetical protein
VSEQCGCGDEGHLCEKHEAEAMAEHAYLRNVPRSAVFGGGMSESEKQELRHAGRGHLVQS